MLELTMPRLTNEEYADLLKWRMEDLIRRINAGEDKETYLKDKEELEDDFREFKAFIMAQRAKIEAAELAAATVVPTVEATIEEPEIEPEEEEEQEEEDYSNDESEEEDDDYALYQQFFSRDEYEIIFNEELDITEGQRSAFILSLRGKNPVVDSFLAQWEHRDKIMEIIDPYNEIPKTEIVRDGDIIRVRYVDGPPAGKEIRFSEEPKEEADDASKEVTLDATFEPAITTIPEDSSPIINGDVAHHPEPAIELSLDNARDELSIESIESVDQELSEEIQTETDSLSIDESATVDRHREETQVSLDFCTPIVQDSQAQSNTSVDFVFSQEAFQHNPDPLMADEEPTEAWNPINFLFGIIGFLKNGAKMLASKIDRRRTKGALALPFDSYD